jgi:short-subunit dehydrogenase
MYKPKIMKTALITGASRGIGFAISEALAKQSYRLILVSKDNQRLQLAKTRLQESSPHSIATVSVDLRKSDDTKKALEVS